MEGCGGLGLGREGWWYGLWCWVGGLGGGCVGVVGEKLGYEVGVHCCCLEEEEVDGGWLVVRSLGGCLGFLSWGFFYCGVNGDIAIQ